MHKEEDTAGLRDHSTTKENTTKTTPTDLKMPGLIESIQCRECGQNLYRDQSTAAPDESLLCYDCKWTRNHDLVLQHLKGKRFLDNVDEVIENIEDVNAPHKYGQVRNPTTGSYISTEHYTIREPQMFLDCVDFTDRQILVL